MYPSIRTADEPTVRLLDGLVGFWLVLWLVVGALSGYTLWQVSDLGNTVSRSGHALESAGESLQQVGEIPVLGSGADDLGDEAVGTGREVAASGQQVERQFRRLSVLLGLSIMVIPTTPLLGLYLPLRLARRREVAALRRLLAGEGHNPALDRHLAERAMERLPYATVRAISADPWADISAGRTRALADVELARLGLVRPQE